MSNLRIKDILGEVVISTTSITESTNIMEALQYIQFLEESIATLKANVAANQRAADLWCTLLSVCDFGEFGVYRHIITDSWGSQKEEWIDDTEIEAEVSKHVEIHKEIKRIRDERKLSDTSAQEDK